MKDSAKAMGFEKKPISNSFSANAFAYGSSHLLVNPANLMWFISLCCVDGVHHFDDSPRNGATDQP